MLLQNFQDRVLAYLTSDHLDVYVATSMRLRHEYLMINNAVNSIFKSKHLSDLKIRWFDPTQAYCEDRIDKGLSEGLMLRRAKCTLYLAQESDTLGKDSELASTLAQGKPVIAYIPKGDRKLVEDLISQLLKTNKNEDEKTIIFQQLKVFAPELAWNSDKESKEIRNWIDNPPRVTVEELKEILYLEVEKHYEKRATTLKEEQPLGIQVNLETGVANGVLVVRSIEDCARLIRAILQRKKIFK